MIENVGVILSVIATVTIAFIGFFFISKPQKEDFRFRLFEKRLDTYNKLYAFLLFLKNDPCQFNGSRLSHYDRYTRDMPFIFGKDVIDCCDKIRHCINQLDHRESPKRDNTEDIVTEFGSLVEEFSLLIHPYIDISKYKKYQKPQFAKNWILNIMKNKNRQKHPKKYKETQAENQATTTTLTTSHAHQQNLSKTLTQNNNILIHACDGSKIETKSSDDQIELVQQMVEQSDHGKENK